MYSPGRPLPLCGACDVVQVLDSSRCRPPLLPAGSRNIQCSVDMVKQPQNHLAVLCLPPKSHHMQISYSYSLTPVLQGSIYCLGFATASQKAPSEMIRDFPKLTHPSGRSLSNSRLQSTTGPPVPIRSLDCRLTAATHGKQMHTLGLLDSRLQCRQIYFIKAQNAAIYLYE